MTKLSQSKAAIAALAVGLGTLALHFHVTAIEEASELRSAALQAPDDAAQTSSYDHTMQRLADTFCQTHTCDFGILMARLKGH